MKSVLIQLMQIFIHANRSKNPSLTKVCECVCAWECECVCVVCVREKRERERERERQRFESKKLLTIWKCFYLMVSVFRNLKKTRNKIRNERQVNNTTIPFISKYFNFLVNCDSIACDCCGMLALKSNYTYAFGIEHQSCNLVIDMYV